MRKILAQTKLVRKYQTAVLFRAIEQFNFGSDSQVAPFWEMAVAGYGISRDGGGANTNEPFDTQSWNLPACYLTRLRAIGAKQIKKRKTILITPWAE